MKNLRNQTDELFISATINKIKSDNLYKIKIQLTINYLRGIGIQMLNINKKIFQII